MGNFTIKINHLTQINSVMLLVNSGCLKSVSAASEHLAVPKDYVQITSLEQLR